MREGGEGWSPPHSRLGRPLQLICPLRKWGSAVVVYSHYKTIIQLCLVPKKCIDARATQKSLVILEPDMQLINGKCEAIVRFKWTFNPFFRSLYSSGLLTTFCGLSELTSNQTPVFDILYFWKLTHRIDYSVAIKQPETLTLWDEVSEPHAYPTTTIFFPILSSNR